MSNFVSIGIVCKTLGISLSTAYRWIKSGKIKESFRTFGLHRRFDLDSITNQFFPQSNSVTKVAVYSRVSSHDQKLDLIRQQDKLVQFCKDNSYNNIEIISDLGSGLNFKKSGLNKLFNLILKKQISTLIINHKDRLLRFDSELIFKLCKHNNINVIILEEKSLSFEQELSHNVIELMTVFCAKLYGKRTHQNKSKIVKSR